MDLKGIDWSSMSKRLTRFAYACIRNSSWEDAEDLAQQAIAQLYDAELAPWDHDKHPDLFDHLTGAVRGLVSNRRRKAKHRKADPLDESHEKKIDSCAPGPERDVAAREHAERLLAAAEAGLTQDPEALLVARCFRREIDSPAEQREATGLDVKTALKNARKRFFRKVADVRRAMEAEGDES